MIELPDHPWFLACQFHPELSGALGAALIARWLKIARAMEAA